jgi:atypical dual specificity phosphatase
MHLEFRWLISGKLAGSAQPGLLGSWNLDMDHIREQGIDVIVSLTEDALAPDPSTVGFQFLHFPIDDMGIPFPRESAELCRTVRRHMDQGRAVLLHCRAGKGRTGTMLACCLISNGQSAEEALREVRRVNRHYVESDAQEAFLKHFEEYFATHSESSRQSDR